MVSKQVSEQDTFSNLKEFNKMDAIIQILDTDKKASVEELDRKLSSKNESVQYTILRIGQAVDEIEITEENGKHLLRLKREIDYDNHTPLSTLIDQKDIHHKFECKTCGFSGDHAFAKRHRKDFGHYYWKLVQK